MGAATGARCVLEAWSAHERELLGFLERRAGDRDEARDIVQEVFVRAMVHRQVFCGLDNPRAWLFRVARNALVDRARLAKPTVEMTDAFAQPVEETPAVEELVQCLPLVLSELRKEDRDILARCDVEGEPQAAYAAKAGLSLSAAKSRLLRARRHLRDHLVEHCRVSFDETGRVCCHVPRES